jgi:hypothetical protein
MNSERIGTSMHDPVSRSMTIPTRTISQMVTKASIVAAPFRLRADSFRAESVESVLGHVESSTPVGN